MGGAFSFTAWDELEKEEEKFVKAEIEEHILNRLFALNDIESEAGQRLFQKMAKRIRFLNQSDAEEGKTARITYLPWENIESKDLETRVRREVFGLSKDYNLLSQPKSCLEFAFRFNMEDYAFISTAMLKYDRNLSETRDRLVPDEVDEEDFWFNYFYGIERMKQELGLPSRLGGKFG